MNDRYTDEELKEKYGLRPEGTGLDFPEELGYRCPKGHGHIMWSEFQEHIWCYQCEKDYHYALDCVLVEDQHNPRNLSMQPRVIRGMNNWSEDGHSCPDIPHELLERENDKEVE